MTTTPAARPASDVLDELVRSVGPSGFLFAMTEVAPTQESPINWAAAAPGMTALAPVELFKEKIISLQKTDPIVDWSLTQGTTRRIAKWGWQIGVPR